jgi:putative ABC transport system permease protein
MLIRNYYRTAVRQIARSRFHTGINVIGLSVGIAFSLLIAAFGWSEWRVNRDLSHADRQYFLQSNWKDPNMGADITTLGPLARALKENYPSLVANYYRWDGIDCNVSAGDRSFKEGIQLGDSTLISMYGFKLLEGDVRTALRDPFTIVITAGKAIKYFGHTDVVGRNLTIQNFAGGKQDFRVTGVMEDPARNSVTWLNGVNDNRMFISNVNMAFFNRNMDWRNPYIVSYIELQKGVRPEELAEPISHLIKVNAAPNVYANLHVDPRPLTGYYLANVRKMLFTLFYIAAFILLMAVINFVNLAVSRSASRMREIGVRKVLGGMRRQLIGQFLAESILLALLATGLALVLYIGFDHLFSSMLGKEIPSLTALPAVIWILIPVFALMLGALAGLYPAVVLSSIPSVDSLRGRSGSVREHTLLRKGLVSFQFAIAMVALVGAVIISQQIRLFFSDRLGYSKEYVVSAPLPRDWSSTGVQHMEAVRAVFAGLQGVKAAALSYEIPNGNNGNSLGIYREGGDSTRAVVAQQFNADEHYGDTYQITLAAGAFFNGAGEGSINDTFRVVINETAAHALGWAQAGTAVGQRLRLFGAPPVFTVAGVVKDFHFDKMGSAIAPEIFLHLSLANAYRFISFKLQPGNMATALSDLQKQWLRLLPGSPFEYKFMDETLAALYDDELRLQIAANAATVLSLFIVLMGVIGLLSQSVQKRTKEIAIRKVIGASVPGIVQLFIKEYLPLLLGAGLVASPFAYWMLQRWLDDYATRITITVFPFALALGGLVVLMVMLIVVQTSKAALANPVNSLKAE